MRRGGWLWREERGTILAECLVALPVVLLLLLSLTAASVCFFKAYFFTLRSWELQQELRICLERIVQDVKLAAWVDVDGGEDTALHLGRYDAAGSFNELYYKYYHDIPGTMKKMKRHGYAAPQPITGGSMPGSITLTQVVFEMREEKLFILLQGKDRWTEQTGEVTTAVCLPEEMKQDVLWHMER